MKLSSVLKIVEDITLMKYKPNMGEFRKKANAKEKYIYIHTHTYHTYTYMILVLVTFTETLFSIYFPTIPI